jgi:hypothetical protein
MGAGDSGGVGEHGMVRNGSVMAPHTPPLSLCEKIAALIVLAYGRGARGDALFDREVRIMYARWKAFYRRSISRYEYATWRGRTSEASPFAAKQFIFATYY